jgi:hypothetical protein
MDRLNALLRLATVANCLADRHDPLRENPFADKSAGPQLLEKFALGDDAIAMLQEIREDVDGVRLQRTHRPGAPQFIPVSIERIRPKSVDHRRTLPSNHIGHRDSRNRTDKHEEFAANWGRRDDNRALDETLRRSSWSVRLD